MVLLLSDSSEIIIKPSECQSELAIITEFLLICGGLHKETCQYMQRCEFCVCVCDCVMYRLWKLTAGGQSRCQVAAGNLKESRRGAGGLVSKPDLLYRINVLIKEQNGIKAMPNIKKRKSKLFDLKHIYNISYIKCVY